MITHWPDWVLPANWQMSNGYQAVTTLRTSPRQWHPPVDGPTDGRQTTEAFGPQVPGGRNDLLRALGLPSAPQWLRQVHGTQVARLSGTASTTFPQADAAVTSDPSTVLAVVTADCLPVAMAAPQVGVIAIAHAGWRGLAAGILEQTVAAMSCPTSLISVWLGPSAGALDYVVGEDVYEAFVGRDATADVAFVRVQQGQWLMDAQKLARQRLTQSGVVLAQIFSQPACTIRDSARFYSYRRDRTNHRMATIVWRTSSVSRDGINLLPTPVA